MHVICEVGYSYVTWLYLTLPQLKSSNSGREPSRVQRPWFLRCALCGITWDVNNMSNHQQLRVWMVLMDLTSLTSLTYIECSHSSCVVQGVVMVYPYEMIKRNQSPSCTTSDVKLSELFFCWSWNGFMGSILGGKLFTLHFQTPGCQSSVQSCPGARRLSSCEAKILGSMTSRIPFQTYVYRWTWNKWNPRSPHLFQKPGLVAHCRCGWWFFAVRLP